MVRSNISSNIFGLADMVKNRFRVTYDSDKEDTFMIYEKKNKKLVAKFTRTPEGLYAFKPPRKYFEMVAKEKRLTVPDYYESMVTTVEDNKKKYTKRQYEDATVARKLYHILGAPIIMKTNAGNKKLSLIGKVKEFGKVWYDPTSVVNIFGLADIVKNGFRVKYDSDKEDTFMIYEKKNIYINFCCLCKTYWEPTEQDYS